MPYSLPSITQLPALASLTQQPEEPYHHGTGIVSKASSTGLESYRSSFGSCDGEAVRRPSSSSSISNLPQYSDCAVVSPAETHSPHVETPSGSRSQSISLPPISELIAAPAAAAHQQHQQQQPTLETSAFDTTQQHGLPNTSSTPQAKAELRSHSNPHSPHSYNASLPPHPLHTQVQAIAHETRPVIHRHASMVAPAPQFNYGYTTQAVVSPPFYPPRAHSVIDFQTHPLAPHRKQQMYFQHAHTQPQTPRSQPQVVYIPHGAHPQFYQHQHVYMQPPLMSPSGMVVMMVPTDEQPTSPKSCDEDHLHAKKEVKRRTRTGCLTCRRRRIKCDERKPHCSKCEKSKIWCAGYQQVRPTKSEMKKTNKAMKVGAILG